MSPKSADLLNLSLKGASLAAWTFAACNDLSVKVDGTMPIASAFECLFCLWVRLLYRVLACLSACSLACLFTCLFACLRCLFALL